MTSSTNVARRDFLRQTALAGTLAAGAVTWGAPSWTVAETPGRKIKVGLIGCGSVSNIYLPHLADCAHVELVSVCDIIPERAQRQAQRFHIPHHYPHIDHMLAGAPFELLVNTTDMQEHERLNRQALEAGRHVWSEKPMANTLAGGQELLALAARRGLRIWGAPTVVNSPQFAFMARTLAAGTLGRVAAGHADYGHQGPNWSAFFYERGGGSMPDLGVYNLTTLTGLLGPARSVVAMTSIVTPTRTVDNKGEIQVTEEDNAMLLLDHGGGVISHVQCGFNYFNPHGHDGSEEERHTIKIVGHQGTLSLVGYDWAPRAVDVASESQPSYQRLATDPGDYVWEQGASLVARCLATGEEPPFTAEHALHVCEIMIAARQSQATGRRVTLQTTFAPPRVA
ncbi:MAG: Gfo/Idh/MocA family oxidoreductase [Pirellulaceae bacterium]|jgi:predicted dehydrogenase|nr:Gfo/Idh/MocA family oxidoreductase [Pirellulaceae bacterium]